MDARAKGASEARNEVLGDRIEVLLAQFEQQRREIAEARARVAAMTAEAWSPDRLVRVVCDASGVPKEVHLVPEAFKRSTPEKLGRAMARAARAAAALAEERSRAAFAASMDIADAAPDLPDLVPGAPGIKELFQEMLPDSSQPQAIDEDEYYRTGSYLRDGR
ncbi:MULTISPECIES: YbaB/EbfC family nucleoid-associated protein [unclassified Nocardia]|uniref:YbaB/EbfC family nucleoid-associated protein n=1 Tax=unclassified Nocardia TaxID=2637762 RepID=UPI001CE3E535|nr:MULTISPECIES: YbaB/EbfC family nucleoid-associated protein [unclassified Nocardia]